MVFAQIFISYKSVQYKRSILVQMEVCRQDKSSQSTTRSPLGGFGQLGTRLLNAITSLVNATYLWLNFHPSLCTHGYRCVALCYQVKPLCFQVGKQFDALLVDTSIPVFDTFAGDTMNVSKAINIT